jgi:hypothetical protein
MSTRPSLAQLLAESARNVERKRAETSKDYTCPHCGGVLEGWRPSEITSDTKNDDGVNEQDDDEDVQELDAKGKSRVVAELLRNHKRRR